MLFIEIGLLWQIIVENSPFYRFLNPFPQMIEIIFQSFFKIVYYCALPNKSPWTQDYHQK